MVQIGTSNKGGTTMSPRGRPKGAKNRTTEQKAAEQAAKSAKPPSNRGRKPSKAKVDIAKWVQTVPQDTQPVVVSDIPKEHIPAPGDAPVDPILAAIQGLSANINNMREEFDHRLSDLENGRVMNPITGEHIPQHHTMPSVPSHSSSSTVLDTTSPLPTYSPDIMKNVNREADAIIKSTGFDKVKTNETVSLGRPEKMGRYDVACFVCGRPPHPDSRGALPHNYIEVTMQNGGKQFVYVHEECVAGIRNR